MTPSIIRRFARYHGIDTTTADGWPASDGYIIDTAATSLRLTRDAVVKSLTRIEDAEMLMGRIAEASKTLAYPGMDDNIVASTVRDFYAFDVDRLLILAGVNPAKWREVKDEEA